MHMPRKSQHEPTGKVLVIHSKQRQYRISAEWLRTYQENRLEFLRQTEELVEAMRDGDVEPCELNPYYEIGLLFAAYTDVQWRRIPQSDY
jgi:hypothetical protein